MSDSALYNEVMRELKAINGLLAETNGILNKILATTAESNSSAVCGSGDNLKPINPSSRPIPKYKKCFDSDLDIDF